jgi:hypothetical protein
LKDKTGCEIIMHQDDLGLYEKVWSNDVIVSFVSNLIPGIL